jgi:hypothetical protein
LRTPGIDFGRDRVVAVGEEAVERVARQRNDASEGLQINEETQAQRDGKRKVAREPEERRA